MKKIFILYLLAIIACQKIHAQEQDDTARQIGIKLIKSFEGLKLKAYKDGKMMQKGKFVKSCSIGYGTSYYEKSKKYNRKANVKVKCNEKITQAKAEEELNLTVNSIEARLSKYEFYQKCNILQQGVIMSLVYNLGFNGFINSELPIRISIYNHSLNLIMHDNNQQDYINRMRTMALEELFITFKKNNKGNNKLNSRRIKEFYIFVL